MKYARMALIFVVVLLVISIARNQVRPFYAFELITNEDYVPILDELQRLPDNLSHEYDIAHHYDFFTVAKEHFENLGIDPKLVRVPPVSKARTNELKQRIDGSLPIIGKVDDTYYLHATWNTVAIDEFCPHVWKLYCGPIASIVSVREEVNLFKERLRTYARGYGTFGWQYWGYPPLLFSVPRDTRILAVRAFGYRRQRVSVTEVLTAKQRGIVQRALEALLADNDFR